MEGWINEGRKEGRIKDGRKKDGRTEGRMKDEGRKVEGGEDEGRKEGRHLGCRNGSRLGDLPLRPPEKEGRKGEGTERERRN
jgi:hypothetical protein